MEDCKKNKDKILNQYIKVILKIMNQSLNKIQTKKEAVDLTYKLRYFEEIPVSKHASISKIETVKKDIQTLENKLITTACNLKAINVISEDVSENYKIIMKIINVGIIDLECINIEMKKQEGKYIINIYEDKSFEKEVTIQKIQNLYIKPNKMIKLFN